MKTVLQMEKYTRTEKLRAMEELWRDLSQSDGEIESPAWHGDVLKSRDAAVAAGEDTFVPWEEAKKILLDRRT